MKTIVLYYSFGGTTRRLATALAAELSAELYEVKYQTPRNIFTAFLACPAAGMQKTAKVQPITAELSDYDKIILMAPVWASHPAPPFNNMVELLPPGKSVEVRLVSGGGQSEKQKVIDLVQAKGCTVTEYLDIRGGETSG